MAEPLPDAVFEALMKQIGLTDLDAEEREGIRLATRHVAEFAARLRASGAVPVEVEPAPRFAPTEAAS